MKRFTWLAAAFACAVPALASNDLPEVGKAPMAKKVTHQETVNGDKLSDDYYWLREKSNPEVRSYLESENAYADAVMKGTEAIQEALYKEMLGRIKETDLSVPFRDRGYFYYSRTEQGKQYNIFCRKKGSLEAPEQVTLDLNEMAKGERFMAVGDQEVTDDGNLLAYTTDNTGFRDYRLHIRDLSTGKDFPETVEKVSSVAWAADNKTLFYGVDDSAKRPYRIYRHILGTDPKTDALVYEEKDEMFTVGVDRSRSGKIIFLASRSHTAGEWRFIPAGDPTKAPMLIAAREKDHEYAVDHRGDLFYIRTNNGCRNFRVVTAPVASSGPSSWKEFLPCRPAVMVSGLEVFSGNAVVLEREDGLPRIRVIDLASGAQHRVDFPEAVYAVGPQANAEFDTKLFRFGYQSFTTPSSVYDYDMATKERKLLKRTEVLGGYDPDKYQSERRYATASDGTKIPISLVYRKGFVADGKAPLWLNGYGSYGIPSFATFSSTRFTLLDRGFVFAIAHIRGGGEMGKPWHDQGRMMAKKNTFTDFIAVAEQLIADKYTSRDRLVIEGGSAGGLLMGAVTNMRPDLFKIVVTRVPFVDVINTMLDDVAAADRGRVRGVGQPEEEGRVRVHQVLQPVRQPGGEGLSRRCSSRHPSTTARSCTGSRPSTSRRLRSLKTDSNPLLFKINMAGGHGGSSGRYDRLKELAFDYAFVFKQLGIR